MKQIKNEIINKSNDLINNDINIDEDYANEINEIIDNNIITQFSHKTDFKRRKNINVNFYNIINNNARARDCIRLRALKFFANTIYNKANVNRLISYYFKCHKNFKSFIESHVELQSSSVYESLIYIF